MYIKRALTSILVQASQMSKIILVTGPRQVGKLTLLKTEFGSTIPYVTLDDLDQLNLAKGDPKLFFKQHHVPLMIDEVQYAPELFSTMKLIVDEQEETGILYLTGSQAYHLMKHVSESLAGRIMIFELSGLTLRELLQVEFDQPFLPTMEYIEDRAVYDHQIDSIWDIIHRGSMPALQNDHIRWDWYYRDYVKSYIERDVRDLVRIKDEALFYKFLVSIAARSGQIIVYSDIASDLGISVKTVQNWTSILEASGLIHILQPYFNNVLKRSIKSAKLYIMDTGLLCYLVGWNTPKSAMSGAMAGNIFETFVISEVIKSYQNAGKDVRNLYYYRDKDKREIDLIILEDQILYPIEIKMGATPKKEWIKHFSILQQLHEITIGDGAVICQCDQPIFIDEHSRAIPVEYL